MFKKTGCAAFAIVCVGVGGLGVASAGDFELLKIAAVQNRTNVEAISTWQGRVEITEQRSSGNTTRRNKSVVTYAFDRDSQAKRWNWDSMDLEDGSKTQGGDAVYISGMIKEDLFYRMGPIPKSHKGRRVVVIHGEKNISFGPGSVDFDPMYCFTDYGEPLHERFSKLYEIISEGNGNAWSIDRVGHTVILTSESGRPDVGKVVSSYTIDLSKGANVVAYKGSDKNTESSLTYDFKLISNSWVPIKYVYESSRTRERTYFRREARWLENHVNLPPDESLFSLAALGALEGDRVKDSRSGTQYTIGGREAARKASSNRGH